MLAGVPDSSLKGWLKDQKEKAIITTDEGEAVGLAVGYYLAKSDTATVFMGSDGLCNALNAITSLIIPYGVPINLTIGIRADCPQHEVMGKHAKEILSIIGADRYCHITYVEENS